jgi:hypothetical protein
MVNFIPAPPPIIPRARAVCSVPKGDGGHTPAHSGPEASRAQQRSGDSNGHDSTAAAGTQALGHFVPTSAVVSKD